MSCSLSQWSTPLYDGVSNLLNPCFLQLVSGAISGMMSLFMLSQLIKHLFFNSFGPYPIKYLYGSITTKSVGALSLLRLDVVVIQLVSLLLQFSLVRTVSVLIQFIVAAMVVTPLHFIEPTRSIIPCTSLLVYWSLNSFVRGIILIQDVFSDHKVYATDELTLTIEVLLLLNSVVIFFLELWYTPSKELKEYYDLNNWDHTRVMSVYERFYFTFMRRIIDISHKSKNLRAQDLPGFTIDADNSVAYNKFLKNWNASVERTQKINEKRFKEAMRTGKPYVKKYPALFLPVLKLPLAYFVRTSLSEYTDFFVQLCQPYLLKRFLSFASNRYLAQTVQKEPAIIGFSIATLIYITYVIRYVAYNKMVCNWEIISHIIEQALSTHVYNKAMKLLLKERENKSVGEIISHVSQDVQTLATTAGIITDSIFQPLRLALYLYVLKSFLGSAAYAGLFVSFILIPIASGGYTYVLHQQRTLLKHKDSRTKLTSEILGTIRSIKLYSWEEPMLKRLFDIRNNKELQVLKKIGILSTVIEFIWDTIPFAITIATFASAAFVSKVNLTPEVIFPSLTILAALSEPISIMPKTLNQISKTKVALDRLSRFFVLEELDSRVEKYHELLKKGESAVTIKNATFVWENKAEGMIALKDITFEAKKGELSCIVGRVGSGKTTFLESILGCIPLSKGRAQVHSTIAYCSQSPWILNTSVRDNILFGRRYTKEFYEAAVDACDLTKDFEILPDGDKTIVGEKGISLSGGQKARISLARAVYSRAEIYILDDVLSAVDTHVGKNIINKVLGGLLKTKTVILATNSVPVLHEADNIILLQKGEILERGSFESVMSNHSDLSQLIVEFSKYDEEVEDELEELDALVENSGTRQANEVEDSDTPFVPFSQDLADDSRTMQAEVNNGKVSVSIYRDYIEVCGLKSVATYTAFMVLSTIVTLSNTYVLKWWSEMNDKAGHNVSVGFFLSLYGVFGVSGMLFTVLASLIIRIFLAINGSRYFHDKMAKSVLRSPMSLFETTPVGRILNRFTADIDVIDTQLIYTITEFIAAIFKAVTVLGVVVLTVPYMLFVLLPLVFFYDHFRRLYIPASRELKRLNSAAKSPVITHIQESVVGVDTILAYGQLDRFSYRWSAYMNELVKVSQANVNISRWLAMRLQGLSSTVVYACALLLFMSSIGSSPISPSTVGFIMTYILNVTGTLNSIVRKYADLESKTVTVERLIEYCTLKPEAEPILQNRPPENWPQYGKVSFVGYETKYRQNLDPALKDISVDIKPGEKVGIVGRTGAGKSTLTMALFRMIEATSGYIEIDGIKINDVGLQDLRSRLNIIPQDSQVFEGSIRQNLDPVGRHTDEELWKVLELSHMKGHIMEREGLDAVVGEGSLSAGQRQLMCLARALLNPSKILVLDEATASVDVQTDKIVQGTIRSAFKDKTILTVAHRLETIMDSDKILVLDKGKVTEFGPPKDLLEKKGVFYFLAQQGGHI